MRIVVIEHEPMLLILQEALPTMPIDTTMGRKQDCAAALARSVYL
jgi:hypothetical protein